MAQQVGQFVNPVLQALKRLGGSARPAQVCDEVARDLGLEGTATLEEKLSTGASRFANKIAWVRLYLVLSGYLDRSKRGLWTLTEKGMHAPILSDSELKELLLTIQRKSKKIRESDESTVEPCVDFEELDDNGELTSDRPDASQIQSQPYRREDAMEDLFMPVTKLDGIIRLLKKKQNVVLQGAPGTGKTFVARRIAYLLMEEMDESRAPMVQFHQSTTYEDFVQGYRPDGKGGFSLKNGTFYGFCHRASLEPARAFVFIIDEINRGNLSKVFGELMMLIESDKRGAAYALPLSYATSADEIFFVPPNVFLIGTMNTADRSLSLVDYALRRRFAFVELDPGFDSPVFAATLQKRGASPELVAKIRMRMNALNQLIEGDPGDLGRGYRIGHSFFVPSSATTADELWLDDIINFEIVPLIEEYWIDDPKKRSHALQIVRG